MLGVAILSTDPEVKTTTVLATQGRNPPEPLLSRLEHFSDCTKMKSAVGVILRKVRSKTLLDRKPELSPEGYKRLTTEELHSAEICILRLVQQATLTEGTTLTGLDPFLGEDGLLRVGGKVKHINYSDQFKFPVILPRSHHVTRTIIRHYHEKTSHQWRGMTTNQIRSQGFWVQHCSSAVASFIKQCVTCKRIRAAVEEQKMADLPADWVNPAPPFTYCGVDLFGPWLIKEGRKELKWYGVMFTCMASRAIHIEVANALSTDAFINALRRLISIRGPVRQLRSDKGTNFVGADRELREALTELDWEQVGTFLQGEQCDRITFKMNAPSASHAGGVWERQIRSARNLLAGLMRQSGTQLDDESLRILMYEAAAIVNGRPLTTDNLYDPHSLEPLTPNHLLTMKTEVVLPTPGNFQSADAYGRKRWRRVQHLLNVFWSRWKNEFLQSLQDRQKWKTPRRNVSVGDVVLIRDQDLPRNRWQLPRVVQVFPSKDGLVCRVRLALADQSLSNQGKRTKPVTYLERPIQKLVLLLENTDCGTV